MIHRAKVGLQNTKQIVGYSPLYSPSNHKKGSTIKQSKFSPKPNQRENKENNQQKQPKTDRIKEEKYFKISKQETIQSIKKPCKNSKISISISVNEKRKSISQFEEFDLLNFETPKFKCSSNKIDDRCKTENLNPTENYFSFGEQFRDNIKIRLKSKDFINFPNEKKSTNLIKEKGKNYQLISSANKKSPLDVSKKKEKIKQIEQKAQVKFMNNQRQINESKFKRERDIFCFRK